MYKIKTNKLFISVLSLLLFGCSPDSLKTSNDKNEFKRFEPFWIKFFSIKGKIRSCSTNKYGTSNYGYNNKPASIALFLFGVPSGNKTKKALLIAKLQ